MCQLGAATFQRVWVHKSHFCPTKTKSITTIKSQAESQNWAISGTPVGHFYTPHN